LVVSVGLALFAAGYRSTLERGARDEAGFASPFDVSLTEGAKLMQPLDVASLSRYEHLAPGVRAYPILRTSADVPGQGTIGQGVTALGIPAAGLEHMYWRSDFAPSSRSHLARALAEGGAASLRGPVLPNNAATFRVRVGVSGTPIELALVLQDSGGRIRF